MQGARSGRHTHVVRHLRAPYRWQPIGSAPTTHPARFADLIGEYAERYERPVWVGETNLRGYPSDRATWFKYVLEQSEIAAAGGVDLRGFCWFPFVDSCDWDS